MKFNFLQSVACAVIFLMLSSQASYSGELTTTQNPIFNLPRADVRYQISKTENIWNFLELDTQTGRIWQLSFSVDNDSANMRLPINEQKLSTEGKNGRFILLPTQNMWNFILLDQDIGRSWQVQFGFKATERFVSPISE